MSKNPVTGDRLITGVQNINFDEGFDLIWGKKAKLKVPAGYTAEELDQDNPYNQWMNDEKSSSGEV